MRLAVLLLITLAVYQYSAVDSSNSEQDAGRAISKLLQEKISKKFKEAANEVKGVLVKHLGDSLKSAHNRMNPKKKKKLLKALKGQGAAAHMNKAGRHRKNSGPVAPPKPNAQQMGPFGMPLPGQPNPQPGPQQPQQPQQALQRPGVAQCGGQCPSTCAPTCDNTCCQMAMQTPPGGCPSSCSNACFSYCPRHCCPHIKR